MPRLLPASRPRPLRLRRRSIGAYALAVLFLAVVVGGPLAGPASAHTRLRHSTPAENATVSSPRQVALTFTDQVPPGQARVQILSVDGTRHEAGAPEIRGDTVTQKVKGALPAGKYAVVYLVTSADGHPVKGEVPFTVTSGSAPGSEAAADAESREASGGLVRWIWVFAGLFAGIGIGLGVMLRRNRGEGR